MAAVVKANGYGLGAVAIARALALAGCRRFFVSRFEEGLELRQEFSGHDIFVLDGIAGIDPEEFQENGLIPVLNHPGDLEAWAGEASRQDRKLEAALHFDTGMARLGLPASLIEVEHFDSLRRFELRYVMSHLACADTSDHELNALQLMRFETIGRAVKGVPLSLANSAGIMLGPRFHFDLCRPGIALYGGNPVPSAPSPLQPVIRLMAPVLQVHEIDRKGSTGYGATFALRPGMRLATIGLGYADGMLRAASNVGHVELDGENLPIAGRISMDLLSLDITNLPAGRLRPGDWVPVIHGDCGIDRWAAAAGTIPYEILTRLGTRLKRHYIPAA